MLIETSRERKIVSWNVNGLRACFKKGVLDWVNQFNPDIICLQEIKAQGQDLPHKIANIEGYYSYFNSAKRKGYSGVAVYTKEKPIKVSNTFGLKRFDKEGRFLLLEFKDFMLLCVYLPHGGRKKENLDYKMETYSRLVKLLDTLKNENVILVGDFNVAHKDIDLARPHQNRNNIMFTPEERRELDDIVDLGFVDAFRLFSSEPGNYTWFSYLKDAREKGLGWRIDYVFVSNLLANRLTNAFILRDISFGSDHCPIGILID